MTVCIGSEETKFEIGKMELISKPFQIGERVEMTGSGSIVHWQRTKRIVFRGKQGIDRILQNWKMLKIEWHGISSTSAFSNAVDGIVSVSLCFPFKIKSKMETRRHALVYLKMQIFLHISS